MRKKKRGRPTLGANVKFSIYLAESDVKILARKSAHTGLSMSHIVRAMIRKERRLCA